jgi:hypothetical protein
MIDDSWANPISIGEAFDIGVSSIKQNLGTLLLGFSELFVEIV